eukprot:SM000010S04387  [mRNA]  locus=s10:1294193:1296949:- [translate_table: standard]
MDAAFRALLHAPWRWPPWQIAAPTIGLGFVLLTVLTSSRRAASAGLALDAAPPGLCQALETEDPCRDLLVALRASIADWEMTYGYDTFRRSISVQGDPMLEAQLLKKLLAKKPITVAALGGSITAAGHQKGLNTYAHHLADLLGKVFPLSEATHQVVRAFLPGGGSFIHQYCFLDYLRMLWPQRDEVANFKAADIILVDTAANDFVMLQPGMLHPQMYHVFQNAESLLRQLLQLPSRPVVLYVHFGLFKEKGYTGGFNRSAESILNTVAALYSVPAISMWRALFPVIPFSSKGISTRGKDQVTSNLSYDMNFIDHVHPSPDGHKLTAILVIHYLFTSLLSLFEAGTQYGSSVQLDAGKVDLQADLVAPARPATCELKMPKLNLLEEASNDLNYTEGGIASCAFAGSLELAVPVGTVGNVTGWVLESCGPLFPELLCWKAKSAGKALTVTIRPQPRKKVAILYRIRPVTDPGYQGAGASVLLNANPLGSLVTQIPGNELTHFWLNDTIVPVSTQPAYNLTFIPLTDKFVLHAIVSY